MQITGNFYGTDPSLISVTVDGISCDDPIIIAAETAINCTMPAGTGYGKSVEVVVDGLVGSASIFSYQGKTINKDK